VVGVGVVQERCGLDGHGWVPGGVGEVVVVIQKRRGLVEHAGAPRRDGAVVADKEGRGGAVTGLAICVFLATSSAKNTRWAFLWCCARIMTSWELSSCHPETAIAGRMLGLVPYRVVVGGGGGAQGSNWARTGLQYGW